ncbi:hypothetical protein C9374_010499 [Naegleria lovaniensis]|uniref:Guanine nucleotide-binding protein subunit beta-like protein n=1 Tax=Naegleria lovaniensis TaxID=51637 RepID=A0AA88GFY1_NAELO|nr:uncharacterized protein C9374_010499 [Naegleria lovaniensis]KAG2374755.1 hypothetical protein C9374_010499 [Naegleria lovaniensis]
MASIQEQINKARQEAQSLQEQIKKSMEGGNDAKLSQLDAAPITPTKLKVRNILRGHLGKVYSCAWSPVPDSKLMVSASQDGKLIIWNALTTYKQHAITLRTNWVMTCSYSNSGQYVASGGLDNIVSIFNINQLTEATDSSQPTTPHRELSQHTGYISACKFISNDKQILSSSGDMTCICWDVEMGVQSRPSNRTLVTIGEVCSYFWWSRLDVNCVQFFPNGLSFATASDDNTCRLFDIRASRELKVYSDDSVREGATSISFSKSGRLMYAAYDEKSIVVWDTLKGKIIQNLTNEQNGPDGRVACLAVSPDGNALCTASWDYNLQIWA